VKRTRWIDWTNLALGTYLLCVPLFTTNSTNGSTVWVATSFGLFIIAAAILALARRKRLAAEWTQVVDGALLAACPIIFGFTELTSAAWNAYVIGVVVALLALCTLPSATRARNVSGPARTRERLNNG
jgi:uncharacterized membrane protein HdeD (DUF308 family)